MPEYICVEIKDGFAKLILNRPEARNALTPPLMRELASALKALEENDDVNVIFLMGAGADFCAGVDLKYVLSALLEDSDTLKEELVPWGPIVADLIEGLAKPVIAAVQGRAVAGGLVLADFCDLILADETAIFGDAHAKWGFVPGWQDPQRLARSIGIRRARQLFLTCEPVSAIEAKAMGLVWKIVPAGTLGAAVEKWGAIYKEMNASALAMMKRQFRVIMRTGWQERLDWDELLRKDLLGGFCTPEAAERLATFGKDKGSSDQVR